MTPTRLPLRLLLVATTLGVCAAAQSRPRVIEESQWLDPPGESHRFFAQSVAIDGDWALATALVSPDGTFNYPYRQLALLYRRAGDSWAFDHVLADDSTDAESWNDPKVAMGSGLASVSTSPLRVFQLNGAAWQALPNPFPAPVGEDAWANGNTRIDGSTVAAIAGKCFFGAVTADLTAGAWSAPQPVSGNERDCSIANYSGAMAIDGDTLVVTNPNEDIPYPPTVTRVYERSGAGSAWSPAAALGTGQFGHGVALRGDELFVGAWHPLGNEVWRRAAGSWSLAGRLPTLTGFSSGYDGAAHIARSDELVLVSTTPFDGLPQGIAVYRRVDGEYQHVAQLTSRRGDTLGPVAEISGRTVVVSALAQNVSDRGRLYFFELPEDFSVPAVLQDDFEDGNSSGWTAVSGSQTVTRRGATLVLRMSSSGRGAAVLAASGATNQSVQADVRPSSFASTDRWFGLATRYTDAANHYYVTLRSSGHVNLRRMQAGQFVTLASGALPVAAGGNYRVRLESVGSRHRVYVNGERVIDVLDGKLGSGRVALLTYGASADFDNVVVTPNARTPLYQTEILGEANCRQFLQEQELQQSGTPQWDCLQAAAGFLRQASVDGVARAAIGPVTDDQSVETRLQAEAFSAAGSQDKWLGVMTRYTDADNYYYLVLRNSNSVSLRKLVNGAIVELGHANVSVIPGTWRTLRLEAIGTHLRGFVNGQLLVQAVDTSHPTGISGIATYGTAARFDYLRVVQP